MGARPLGRVIQQEIKKPLADHLLFGDLITGGHVKVDAKEGKICFDIIAAKAEAKKPSGKASGARTPSGKSGNAKSKKREPVR